MIDDHRSVARAGVVGGRTGGGSGLPAGRKKKKE
jgi:hypothetical protein